mgnify:CR=1 FL=1
MKKNNKNEKVNPIIMEQKKVNSIRVATSEHSEDENVIKKLIIISVVIAIIIAIIYGVTELLKKDEIINDPIVAGSINYDKVSVGTILNRPYEEYYVLVYDVEDNNAVLYSTILSKYAQNSEKDSKLKIFYCDLGNSLNNKFYNVGGDNVSNKEPKSVEDFDFSDLTLLKIKNGKITKYIETLDEVKKELK